MRDRNSNYPPGVSGNEPQIVGYDDDGDADEPDDDSVMCFDCAGAGCDYCSHTGRIPRPAAPDLQALRLDAEPAPWHLFDAITLDYWGAPHMPQLPLDKIRQLIADASPLPWSADYTGDDGEPRTDHTAVMRYGGILSSVGEGLVGEIRYEKRADVQLMMYARQLLPAMLDEIEQLRVIVQAVADAPTLYQSVDVPMPSGRAAAIVPAVIGLDLVQRARQLLGKGDE